MPFNHLPVLSKHFKIPQVEVSLTCRKAVNQAAGN